MKHSRILWLLPLCLLTACPDPGSPVAPQPVPTTREKPVRDAIEMTVSSTETRFCCDPFKPFPQKVGELTVRNTNADKKSSAILVAVNLSENRTELADAVETHLVALRAGESHTFEIVANSCDFETATMDIEWGYDGAGMEQRRPLTVTNACPATAQLRTALSILCQPELIDPIFYPTYVVAAIGVLVKHSARLIPAALISALFTEIGGFGAFPLFMTLAKLQAAFNLHGAESAPLFPMGPGPNGFTIYPDMPAEMTEGEYLVVYQVVEEDIPLADPVQMMQYGFVFDADGDSTNNYVPSADFENDFFKGTDRWYAVTYTPREGWRLKVTDARNNDFQELPTAARVVIAGNSMFLLVPRSEFDVPNPGYRVTSFTHKGDYGMRAPYDWSGDPTPAVDQPLAEIK